MVAHEHSDTVRSLSPAANGSTDDVPVPKGLPPPAPPNGLEDEGLPPKGDAELLPLTSPNGLPPHLITDARLPYGRRDVAEDAEPGVLAPPIPFFAPRLRAKCVAHNIHLKKRNFQKKF